MAGDLWLRSIERRARSKVRGSAVSAGIRRGHSAGGSGEKNRTYGCSGHKFGGAAICSNAIGVRQTLLESKLCAPIKNDLAQPQLLEDLERGVVQKQANRAKGGGSDHSARIASLRDQVANLTEAIGAGGSDAAGARGKARGRRVGAG
jgi:hypothetical protein